MSEQEKKWREAFEACVRHEWPGSNTAEDAAWYLFRAAKRQDAERTAELEREILIRMNDRESAKQRAGNLEIQLAELRVKLDALEKQKPFDADDPRFMAEFEKTITGLNMPNARKGFGFRSTYTQACLEVAFEVVNRLRLYAKPTADALEKQEPVGYARDEDITRIDRNGISVFISTVKAFSNWRPLYTKPVSPTNEGDALK